MPKAYIQYSVYAIAYYRFTEVSSRCSNPENYASASAYSVLHYKVGYRLGTVHMHYIQKFIYKHPAISRLSTNEKHVAQTNCRNRTVVTTYQSAENRKAIKRKLPIRLRNALLITTQLPSSVLTLMV